MDLQELVARQEIGDLITVYVQAVDDCAWDVLKRDVFLADATADFPPHGATQGIDAINELIKAVVGGLDSCQHLVGSNLISVSGDAATSRCYFQAQNVFEGAPGTGGDLFGIGGTYDFDFVHTSSGWRISSAKLVLSWTAGNPEVYPAGKARLDASES